MTQPATDLSRRQALKVGAGVVAIAIGGGAAWSRFRTGGPEAAPTDAVRWSAPALSETQINALDELNKSAITSLDPAIAVLGHRYLADHPEESDPALLLDLLPDPADDPIAAASQAVAHEFASGDTVSVAGWVLSASEARAAAVVALACSSSGQC